MKHLLKGPSPGEIEKAVEKTVGKDHVLYRKLCIHLSHRYSGMGLDEIGKHFGMKGSAVSHSSRRFKKDTEDDEGMERTLDRIKKGLCVEC